MPEVCSWNDLKDFCVNTAKDLNDMFDTCQDLMGLSPFSISSVNHGSLNSIMDTVIEVVSGTAMTLCVLFFLMEFAKKSLDLQWVKWENVFLFLFKLIFAKVVVGNSREIMEFIFNLFTGLTNTIQSNLTDTLGSGFLDVSQGERLFLTDAEIELFNGDGWGDSGVWFGLDRLMKEIELMPAIFIAKGVIVVTAIMIFARMFEIMVYTMVSPIPLSTFSSDEHRQIGIGFIKSFAAVCLQGLMIIVMFYTFSIMGDFINTLDGTWLSGSFGILIRTLVLGLGIFKSGSWAKKLCGAM
ncbi:MAG: hypothetical protein NC452_18750 [Eubacterium sp.]|nr:hypothetical protein [Eubacterium sp.]